MKCSKSEYNQMDKLAIDIRMDYGIYSEYLDVFSLAEKMGFKLIPFSFLEKNALTYIKENSKLSDGFTIIRNSDSIYSASIYFNDKVSIERQRFTIAHEIKHIVCKDYAVTEHEESLADYFARVLLAPTCLVYYHIEKGLYDISHTFLISYSAANTALNQAIVKYLGVWCSNTDYEEEYIKLVLHK